MDRRSWLWRRKSSSEKSAGIITESSGSLSSHSERFSDDQEVLKSWPNGVQSPDASVKSAAPGCGSDATVEELAKQLSMALATINAKEDLLKQHAKVTEEAVSGWEKAELEVTNLKKQLNTEARTRDDRINQLEGALKECLEHLRQTKEEQEEKIHEALVQKTRDWDAQKVKLENQIAELESRLEVEKEEHFCDNYEFEQKLEMMERENSELWSEILALSEKLRIETTEKEFCIQTAETASKQHLESRKKMSKLQAECQKLHILCRKTSSSNDEKCHPDSATMDILMDNTLDKSQQIHPTNKETDNGNLWASALISELDQFKSVKETDPSAYASMEINIMDDFLEMERLALSSENHCASHFSEQLGGLNLSDTPVSPSKSELKLAYERTLEMEEKLKRIQHEKAEMEILFAENQEMLRKSSTQTKEAEFQLMEMVSRLDYARASKQDSDEAVKQLEAQRITTESELQKMNTEVEKLQEKLLLFEGKVNEESKLARQFEHRCQALEKELTIKHKANSLRADAAREFLKNKVDKELAVVSSVKFAECQKTITSISRQLKSLATFEDFMLEAESRSISGHSAFTNEETKTLKSLQSADSLSTRLL